MPCYFSVVIPTYNRSSTIRHTLESVQRQSFGDFECLIVDDGSDDLHELNQVVHELGDTRFRVISRENGGGGAARNSGIDAAVGRYIAFLDSDDAFVANKLERFFICLENQPHAAMYSYAHVDRGIPGKTWVRPDRPIRAGESMASYLFVENQFVQTSTIVISAQVAKEIRFDPLLRKGQDLDFCLRLDAAGIKFSMLEEPLILWTDASEAGRTSRHAGAAAPEAWLAKHSHLMSHGEALGYRATVLAYYQPKYKFLIVLRDLYVGVHVAGVPLKVAARQLLRFSLPRSMYRAAVSVALRSLNQRKRNGALP